MRYSLAGTLTLTWPEVADAARTAERLGFDAFYATDHLMGVAGFAPELGILVGGGSRKAVDIAARWATQWNGTGDPAVIAERIGLLRERAAGYGREGQVETSVMLSGSPDRASLARLAEIGVQRVVLSTPRPWHPDKLEALALAVHSAQ